jgi:glucosamine-6-phosphate deaminase
MFTNKVLGRRVTMKESNRKFQVGPLAVCVYDTKEALGREAAREGAAFIQEAIQKYGKARLIFSAANSQLDMVANLAALSGIDWNSVEVFHVDEYVGLSLSHPASFGGWLKRHVVDRVHPARAYYLAGDAKDRESECQRYAELVSLGPIDVSFLGIGENGHIGFNDPHAADFSDLQTVKVVTLDERCRLQQVGEGHWPNLSSVPTQGFTITCPALVNASHIICCVPGPQKAEAVRNTLEGPISVVCPASVIRTHTDAKLCLDVHSASLLSRKDRF